MSIAIPQAFHGAIVGKQAETKTKLEKETRTQIVVPARNSGSSTILIRGPTQNSIDSCHTRITVLVDEAMKRHPPTHFVSLPLNVTPFTDTLPRFTSAVADVGHSIPGFSPELLQSPSAFHVTVIVLKLFTPDQVKAAADHLARIVPVTIADVYPDAPPSIHLKGIDTMTDDPTSTDVLFATLNKDEPAAATRLVGLSMLPNDADDGCQMPSLHGPCCGIIRRGGIL